MYVDGVAEWVDAAEEKRRIWELHATTPEPLGFDPQPHYGSIDHHYYGLLRITPWRIELGNLYGEPLIWRVFFFSFPVPFGIRFIKMSICEDYFVPRYYRQHTIQICDKSKERLLCCDRWGADRLWRAPP